MNQNNNKETLSEERINLRNRMMDYINNNEFIETRNIIVESKDEIFNNAMNKNIYSALEQILKLSNEKL